MTDEESPRRTLVLLGIVLTALTGLFAVAALTAYATGEEVFVRGGGFRTHADAVWVLGTFAVAMAVGAIFVWIELDRPNRVASRERDSLS